MTFDEPGMQHLVVQSQDLHSTAMRLTRDATDDIVEAGRAARTKGEIEIADPGRRGFLRRSLLAAGVVGGGALGASMFSRMVTTVYAASSPDVMMLQTAASIENLAIAVYTKAASLPPAVSGAAIPTVKAFVLMTIKQHQDHANAFNAAAVQLGGMAQTKIDQVVYDAVVTPALGRIKGPADVVALAQTLEDAAAQTYVKFGGDVDDKNALNAFATIAPVEAQHSAVLLAVAALIAGGAPQLITITPPVDATKLPSAAGSVGFPNSFYKTDAARPAAEGALQ
ncbi:MAG TPA: ferritin-like domain-containing protein [Candidatus Dormibacteraeota bacterium]|nr:ferritin-like domain-containing protein [Candidatus Dormibacteraeota bacterium]